MDFPKREQKILKHWNKEGTFRASLKARAKARRFVFFEGPPTANGRPGIHHVLSRTFKDAVCRYQSMRGFLVERKAGWDTHGLPVELEVEKELGLKSKQDIERYGIARFNARCKKSVWRYKDEWEKLTRRIGFWIDLENPYITYKNEYIETLWWIIKNIYDRGLLYEDFKVVPWCARCGSTLSSHEVALGYESVTENSVFVKFRATGAKNTFILGWTTTPWTLPGNVALAVGKDIEYAEVAQGNETYILAAAAVSRIFPERGKIVRKRKGAELVGLSYEPLFDIPETQNTKSHKVYAADFVNTDEGTGIVHTAVMYGEDDYRLGARVGLPKVHTVDEQGRFLPNVPSGLAGRVVKAKNTEQEIITFLKERNLLFLEQEYTHDYPFCWRCKEALLYYAKKSWFIKMSQLRAKLIAQNQRINWIPGHLKEGRFGEWLRELKDWAFSRERYWGTPLPVWRCEKCDALEVIGSLRELGARSKLKNRYILLRHGEATSNIGGWSSCFPEKKKNPLTKRGKAQAKRAAAVLKKYRPDVVVSSPLQRAKETASIVRKELDIPVALDERLQEFNVGTFNTRPIEEYHEFLGYIPEAHWAKKPLGGETWNEVRQRMVAAMCDLEKRYENKTIVVVSHGDPLFVLRGSFLGITNDDFAVSYVRAYTKYQTKAKGRFIPYPEKGKPFVMPRAVLPLDNAGQLDLHRPYVDGLMFSCKKCKGSMRRVPEVADVWFDSGAMPFASQTNASGLRGSAFSPRRSALRYPADFICEGIDQTRGWFYTLLAVATLLGRKRPYKNVISHGHVLDKNGKKMSKSLGNIVNPWDIIERYGADAVRWYFFTVNQPGDPKRFDEKDVKLAHQRFVGTLYNTLSFWRTYSGGGSARTHADTFPRLSASSQRLSAVDVLDKWILSRLSTVVAEVIRLMDVYHLVDAARLLETFAVDDLSNWYVRRSRGRFQRSHNRNDYDRAVAILGYVLETMARLIAPFVPFVSEEMFHAISQGASVHMVDFPKPEKNLLLPDLETDMRNIREAAALGHAERRKVGIRVRQPLAALSIAKDLAPHNDTQKELLTVLADELNVKEIIIGEGFASHTVVLDTKLTPALRAEGVRREVVRILQDLRKEAGLKPKARVRMRLFLSGALHDAFEGHHKELEQAVGAGEILFGPKRVSEKIRAERQTRIDDAAEVWAAIIRA